MSWLDSLKERWKLGSLFQVVIVLVVFACTGFTVVFLRQPLFDYLFESGDRPLWASIVYYILILPVYNVFLLFYGFVFGQFRFFGTSRRDSSPESPAIQERKTKS
ncbi:MAG: DUF6787 family protein [Bacteroidota bacterium]